MEVAMKYFLSELAIFLGVATAYAETVCHVENKASKTDSSSFEGCDCGNCATLGGRTR